MRSNGLLKNDEFIKTNKLERGFNLKVLFQMTSIIDKKLQEPRRLLNLKFMSAVNNDDKTNSKKN
jgi:hypothetical protein